MIQRRHGARFAFAHAARDRRGHDLVVAELIADGESRG
jgi:hypothetical protein